jgi:CBS-domain-containing membrane protein
MSAAVKDVMSTHVMAVRVMASFKEIATRLREQRLSAFPVIDLDGKVIGVVSEADLLAKEALEGTMPRTLQSLTRQRVRSQVNAVTPGDLMTQPAGWPSRRASW